MRTNTIQTAEKRKVTKRTYLSAQEVSRLLSAAKHTRWPLRDQTLILLTFRHGLRATEAATLQWSQVDLRAARLYVARLKGSEDSVHSLEADEVRLLRSLKKASPDNAFVFLTERGTVMTADNFLRLVKRLGTDAGFSFPVHPHMLRHGAGYQLINQPGTSTRQIQHFLGHRNIRHTERYTTLATTAFVGFGRKIGGRV